MPWPVPPRRAFTLIELIVTILILGLLAAVAVIGYSTITARAQAATVTANLRQMSTAVLAASVGDADLTRDTVIEVMRGATGQPVTEGLGAQAWALGSSSESPSADAQFAVGFDNNDHDIDDEHGTRVALIAATPDGRLFAQVFTGDRAGPIVEAEARVTPAILLGAVEPGSTTPTLSDGIVLAPPLIPAVPTGLVVNWATPNFALSWDAPASGVTGFALRRAASLDGPWDTTPIWTGRQQASTDAPPASSAKWCYQLSAVNAAGNWASADPVCASSVPDAPPAPAQPSVVASGASTLTVSWAPVASAPGAPVTGYKLYRQPYNANTWTEEAVISTGTATTFADTPPASTHKTWCYRVVTLGSGVDSAQSSRQCAALASAPAVAATNVRAAGGNGQATVSWMVPSGQLVPIIDAEITVSPAPATGPASRMVGSATTSYVFDGLTNGTLYTFTVKLANGAGTAALASAPSLAVVPAQTVVSMTTSGTWTAPAGVTSVTVVAGGGKGGDAMSQTATGMGGKGSLLVARVTVVPGQTYAVTIGGGGAALGNRNPGGKGGDAADLRPVGGAMNTRILVAGGGGGGGGYSTGTVTNRNGGDAGPVNGSGSYGGPGEGHRAPRSAPGTQTSGFELGVGAEGLAGSTTATGAGGGGGGGGYWGGQGGSGFTGYGGGGGGGSSYAAPGASVLTSTAGANFGAASLAISY